jgi:hypothetical protein
MSSADSYLEYASDYFERQLPADAVAAVIELRPLTAAFVHTLSTPSGRSTT